MASRKATEELIGSIKVARNRFVQDWKEDGRKVFGFHCAYIPEEIIYAAGALPFRIRPVGCTEVSSANVYMTPLHCTLARGCLEFVLTGEFDFLDGLVSMNSCDHIRSIHDICEMTNNSYPFMHFIDVPYVISDQTVEWYRQEIVNFKTSLEGFLGLEITDDLLRAAISTYNETRSLLKKVYELRKQANPPISGSEVMGIVVAASAIPKHQFNQLLGDAIGELSHRKGISDYRARLMIMGSSLDDPDFVEIIEDQGGLVCTDALCFGSRYFWDPVEMDGDLLTNLAKSYLGRPCCARMMGQFSLKYDYLEHMLEDYRIDGVIHQRIRNCDPWGGDLFGTRKRLNEKNIPLLALEREYWPTGVGQLKTRVQAFLESIEARR